VIAVLALLAGVGCVDPADRRPGLWLSGESAPLPESDWSFTEPHREIFLEVRTPYGLRHSLTIVCAADAENLYVGARNPEEKRWVGYVARDPNVRLEIGGALYEARLEPIEDAAARRVAYAAYAAKYGWPDPPPADAPAVKYFRVRARS